MKKHIASVISSHKFRPLAWIGIIAIALLISILVSRQAAAPTPEVSTTPADGSSLTVRGELVCLPHKDTTGPQTEECAYGIKSGETYYALQDSAADYSNLSPLATGTTVSVTGTFSPHPDSNYQDVGIITVSSAKTE